MLKQPSLLAKIILLVLVVGLFVLATYLGKAVNYTHALFFAVGLLIGAALLEADENYLYKFYTEESSQTSQTTHKQMATRSVLFIASLFPLGLFLMTSTGSPVGVGVFLGVSITLAFEFFSFRNNKADFEKRFLYQLKREITVQEHKSFVWLFIAATVLYALIVIFLGR